MNERQLELARHLIAGLNLEDIQPQDLDVDAPLFGAGLGLDSIDALELAVIVERKYGVRIADMEVGRKAFASIRALDDFLAAQPGKTAARASLADPYHVRNGKKRNLETRTMVTSELSQLGFHTLPSQANFIMIDLGRDVRPVIAGLREREVHVGRLFPAMPKHLRVTIGRPEEMAAFLHAFRAVIA